MNPHLYPTDRAMPKGLVTVKITLQQWPLFLEHFNASRPVTVVDETGVEHKDMAVTHYYQKGYGADFECEATYAPIVFAKQQLFVRGKGDFR